ncbi:MAG: 50S ribosomal protein L10 [Actinomycetota bacterium]|nr:50S ribosomal protein L10 [Actinomycetota bacterium]MDA8278911.1 50S ribosomal protein L10 [Actinomycetota bacterium]
MDNPRPEKVAVVEEVRGRLGSADAAILTEYRGLTVADLAALRRSLAAVGGDYKVYKNTLVKLAVTGSDHEPMRDLLTGPTAIAFVSGDVSAVAKALRDFARTNPALVLKGGMLPTGPLSATQLAALADLPTRDVLLARVAGAFAAPMRQMAGLLQALPRNLAYGLKALIDQASDGAVLAAGADDSPAESADGTAVVLGADSGAEPAGAPGPGAPDEVGSTAEADADTPTAPADVTAEAGTASEADVTADADTRTEPADGDAG